MTYTVKYSLIFLLFTVVTHRCDCASSIQRKKTPEQRTHLALPAVTCSARGIRAVFDPLVKNNVHVKDLSGFTVPVGINERSCGVRMGREKNLSLTFFSRYDSCYAHFEGSKVVIPLLVQLTGETRWIRVNISCPLIKRGSEKIPPTSSPGDCHTEKSLRINCSHQSISSNACDKLGCCFDAGSSSCYYKLNACSLDGHFVFTVRATDTHPPIDPSSLVIKDQPHCLPVVTTPHTAVFKIGVMDCGAKMKRDGDLVIYEVEVEEQRMKSKSRQSPFRLKPSQKSGSSPGLRPEFQLHINAVVKSACEDVSAAFWTKLPPSEGLYMQGQGFSSVVYEREMQNSCLQVQCEYEESDLKRAQDLRSFYTVTNPPPVIAQGTMEVQMRIATDASFTSFIPENQLPLISPLRKAVNVEISIAQPSPDPTLSIRVRDCFAYPASKNSVWTLLHDGCPNPLDSMRSSVPVDTQGKTATHSQVRRFDVKTFAFMDPDTGHPSVEEMYFYCWVEICTDDVDCAQRCTIISSEGDGRRRRAMPESHQVQLVSSGPRLQDLT